MASSGEWVRQIEAQCEQDDMPTEAIWKSLERHIGQGEKAMARLDAVLSYIDNALIDHRGGPVMGELLVAVTVYKEKVLEGLAAA